MLEVVLLIIVIIITLFILNINKECNEDRGFRAGTCFFAVVASVMLGAVIEAETSPTIEDYIHGKVRVEVNQIYENGEVVRCDTNYYKL